MLKVTRAFCNVCVMLMCLNCANFIEYPCCMPTWALKATSVTRSDLAIYPDDHTLSTQPDMVHFLYVLILNDCIQFAGQTGTGCDVANPDPDWIAHNQYHHLFSVLPAKKNSRFAAHTCIQIFSVHSVASIRDTQRHVADLYPKKTHICAGHNACLIQICVRCFFAFLLSKDGQISAK